MLTYLSLIPTFLSLDSRIILIRFQGDFINSYLLVNISAINNANQYSFHFTEGYINDWIDRWRREYGNIIGLDPVIKALKQEHKLKLNSSGVVTITCETIDPEYFEFIKSELEFHYDKISINLATIIQEFDYGTPTLIRPLNSLGDDEDMEDLSKKIHQYLQDIFREGVSILALYCIKATRELTETYKGRIAPFILQAGYGELVQIHNSSGTYIQRIRDLNSSVQRTCKSVTNVQQRNWEINCIELDTLSNFFSNLASRAQFIYSIYSSQLDLSGMHSSLIGLGLGLISLYPYVPINQLRIGFLLFSILLVGISSYLWLFNRSKDLITKGLELITKELISSSRSL